MGGLIVVFLLAFSLYVRSVPPKQPKPVTLDPQSIDAQRILEAAQQQAAQAAAAAAAEGGETPVMPQDPPQPEEEEVISMDEEPPQEGGEDVPREPEPEPQGEL